MREFFKKFLVLCFGNTPFAHALYHVLGFILSSLFVLLGLFLGVWLGSLARQLIVSTQPYSWIILIVVGIFLIALYKSIGSNKTLFIDPSKPNLPEKILPPGDDLIP